MSRPRITARSYWLWAGLRLRITYNSRRYDWDGAAFLKIDLLEPKGATLPSHATGHLSHVLRDRDKYEADRDHLACAQRLLGHAVPAGKQQAYAYGAPVTRQLPLF